MQVKKVENIRANFNFYITLLYTNDKKYMLSITYTIKKIKKLKLFFKCGKHLFNCCLFKFSV